MVPPLPTFSSYDCPNTPHRPTEKEVLLRISSASTWNSSVALKMEALRSFETEEHLTTTWRRNPNEDHHTKYLLIPMKSYPRKTEHKAACLPQSVVPAVCPRNYHCSSMAFHLFAFAFEISAAKWLLWRKIRQRLTNSIISGSRMKSVGLLVTRDRKSQPVYGNRSRKRKFRPR
jgi:hypothetical protein